jgi:hypothetical protein
MIFKWALIMFAVMAVGLLAVTKVLSFFNPPRPGRAPSPWLRSAERALRFSLLVPAALALLMLAAAMWGGGAP